MRLKEFFTVNLTDDHIDRGVLGDAECCAVSLALKEHVGNNCSITTRVLGPITITNETKNILMGYTKVDGDNKHVYQFEIEHGYLDMWLRMFDDGVAVPPIEIDFQVDELDPEYGDPDGDEDIIAYVGEAKIVDVSDTIKLFDEQYN